MAADDDPRQLRFSSEFRGLMIAAFIAAYGWFFSQPGASLTQMFLFGAVTQVVVIAIRRFVPPDSAPQAMYIFEMLADGVTVLLFALGVYGGIVRMPQEI
jgi:hypothetical protein